MKKILIGLIIFCIGLNASAQIMNPRTPNTWLSNNYKNTVKRYMPTNTKATIISNNTNSKYNKITLLKGGKDTSLPSSRQALTTRSTSGTTCYTYTNTVKENRDFLTIPVFAEFVNTIYPGYIVDQTSVLNNRFPVNSLPTNVTNRPYTISTNVYNVCSGCNVKTIGSDNVYGFTGYNRKLNEIISTFPQAPSTLPLQRMQCEFMEFSTVEELSMKLGYGLSASIPPEITAMLTTAMGAPPIPAAVNVDVSTNINATTIKDKKRIMMKVAVTYFDVVAEATPTQTNNNLSPLNLINVPSGTTTPNNLLFVRSVSYGSEGYIIFEADMTTTELSSAVNMALGVSSPDLLPGQLDPAKIGVSMDAETRSKFTSGLIRIAGFGKGISLEQPTPITSLDKLKEVLATVKGCNRTNYGVPIAYQMNFVSQMGEQAVKNHTLDYSYKVCSKPPATDMLFDLELQCTGINVKKVGDIGGGESLYGQIDFTWFCGPSGATDGSCRGVCSGGSNCSGGSAWTSDQNLWKMLESNSNNTPFRASDSRQNLGGNKRIIVRKDLTYDQLVNGSIYIQAQLKDDEGIMGSRTFKCMNCQTDAYTYANAVNVGQTDNFYKRMIFFVNHSEAIQNSVNRSMLNTYFTITFSGGQEFNIRMCESGNCNDGESIISFKLFAIPK